MIKNRSKKLRFFLNLVIIAFVFLFAFLYIAPFGNISYHKDFSKDGNRFFSRGNIYKLSPAERIIDDNKMIFDPVYFYLNTFRKFNSAKVNIRYKVVSDNKGLEDIKLGVLLDRDNWNYKLYSIYNNYLNKYIDNYYTQEDEGSVFLQKEKEYEDLKSFIDDKNFSSLLLYNYNLKNDYVIDDYSYGGNHLDIPALKGSHSFYTYIKNHPLKIDFNILEAGENFDIFVYSEDVLIFSDSLDSNLENYSLNLDDLPEGTYKVELKSNSSLVFETRAYLDKLILLNKLNLYNNSEGFNFYSNKKNFRIKFLEAAYLGDIEINGDVFGFDQILKQYNIDIKGDGLSEIKSDACSFLIENNGVFSFTRDSMFNPFLSYLEEGVNIDSFNYIIADYTKPEKKDAYYSSEVNIDLTNALRNEGEYQFIISAPFLEKEEYIEIKSIDIELFWKNHF
jgi:hypothetical protein